MIILQWNNSLLFLKVMIELMIIIIMQFNIISPSNGKLHAFNMNIFVAKAYVIQVGWLQESVFNIWCSLSHF